ncbi:MAG: hypothetical protein JXR73_15900 [Candidatus Omnitrophica bacterium]|nr:hypothetical protein [Candidatus Omnitrophota bacterium]
MKSNAWKMVGVCIIAAALGWPAAAQEAAESPESATPDNPWQAMKLSGSFNTSYYFRSYDGRDDNDVYSFFSLRLKDVVEDYIDGGFSMRWHEDLNSRSPLDDVESYDPFLDLYETSGDRFRFYTGYLDLKQAVFEESRLRLGRQYLEEIDQVHFDGASYQFTPMENFDVTLFGGRPVTFYSSTSGDAVYGSNLSYRFTNQTRAALRYYRYEADPFNDDLIAAELWHMFTPELQAHGEFSLLDGDPYLWKNDLFYRVESWDLDILGQVIHLFEEVGDHTINFNPYLPLLYDYEPFTYGSVLLTKGVGPHVSLTAGFDFRATDENLNPESEYTNRDYVRGTLGAEFYPTKQLTLSFNGEYWSVDDDDRFTGVSGEVEYKPAAQWTLTAGAEYGEYVQEYLDEFLYIFGEEQVFRISPDVITYYARVKWQPTSRIYTAARFEIEDNDLDQDEWYAFRLQVGVNF